MGLFAGEQWVSQVQDFQIKFILVMENVLLLLSICCLFSDRSWKKNSFAKSRGTAEWFLLNNGYLESVDGDDGV